MEVIVKIKMIITILLFSVSAIIAEVKITYGISTHQNQRPYQEDRFTHATIGGRQFFGVYDGHGGAHVSELLARNLLRYFIKASGSIENRFYRAFDQADYKAQLVYPNEGSTALVLLIDKYDVLHCAWAGDTRAVLECNSKACFATDDHKPDRKDEKERIQRAGGKIFFHGVWRVNGLAVSRSIGDASCKKQGIGQIIATPEYATQQLKPDNHFLIMASDGLWDVMSNEDAVALVLYALESKMSLNNIAQMLQNAAIKDGSGDNITVCVVQFDWQEMSKPRESLMRRFWNWLKGN